MAITWLGEAFDYPPDRVTGVPTARLTSSALHHVNVYCEHAYCSPDGNRFAILRSPGADPRLPPFDLLVADLPKRRISVLERDVASILVGTASWSGWIYYVSKAWSLVRVNLTTLEKEVLFPKWEFNEDFILHTISPDLRYMVGQLLQPSFKTALVRIDLVEKTWKKVYEHEEISNAHPVFNPVHGRDLYVVRGHGFAVNDKQEVKELGKHYISHFLLDKDGGNERPLADGPPYTMDVTGHCNWLGGEERIAFTTVWNYDDWTLDRKNPEGNLFTVGAGDKKPKVFVAPEHRFNHIGTSKCGRYFVCDTYPKGVPGPIGLVVGNLQTGKYRDLLTDCGATGGGPACGHPHAYFTGDTRHVIYNANPYLIAHVYAARIPDGFLESLD